MAPEDQALITLLEALRERGYQFTTVTPLTQARVNARPGNSRATDLTGVFGWSRPFDADVLPHELTALMHAANVIADTADGKKRALIRVSTINAQTFVHSAYPTTDANSVFFGPDTIRFVDAIRRHLRERTLPVRRVADVGCGAGPGGIVAAAYTSGSDVVMLDINPLALRYASVNAAANGVRALAQYSNVLADVAGTFDLIVSNPPYLIDAAARAYRHGGGRFGEGLSLEILRQSLLRLSPGGTLLIYTGSAIVAGEDVFATACREVLDASDFRWSYAELDPDVFGEELETPAYVSADRIAAVLLTVTNESPP